jgi:uncharacterized protein (DUF342 family)
MENKNDGYIVVRFSMNDLEAWADFMPPIGDGLPIGNEYLDMVLEELNIVHGVHWDTIKKTALRCNLDRKPVKNVLIALGDPPVSEIPEYFEINPHLAQASPPVPDKNRANQIDYRAFSPYVIVKKDQVLAWKKPRREGRDGKNIRGTVIPMGYEKNEGMAGGEHTRTTDKYILAEINGQLIVTNKVLKVQDNLVIKGSVGYATGNIIFPGDVLIEGMVSDGFKIYSGGSVTIKQTFDVTDVITKMDLNVAGGIIGRGRALVKVGGVLRTKFIENCRVACRRTIFVDSEIINSNIYAMETVEMGDKGKIMGGEIYAIHGIKTAFIGKKFGKATYIHCGVDFTLQQDKEKCNSHLRLVTEKLQKIREFTVRNQAEQDPEKQAKLEELRRRLEEEQKKTAAQIGDMMGRLNADDNAVVEVSGEIAAGTLIEIGQIALFVTEPLKRVRVKLDRNQGKVVTEPLA